MRTTSRLRFQTPIASSAASGSEKSGSITLTAFHARRSSEKGQNNRVPYEVIASSRPCEP